MQATAALHKHSLATANIDQPSVSHFYFRISKLLQICLRIIAHKIVPFLYSIILNISIKPRICCYINLICSLFLM
jgi:hypothetical protein